MHVFVSNARARAPPYREIRNRRRRARGDSSSVQLRCTPSQQIGSTMGGWSTAILSPLYCLLVLLVAAMLSSGGAPANNLSPTGEPGGVDELSAALKFTLDLSLSKSQEDAVVRCIP